MGDQRKLKCKEGQEKEKGVIRRDRGVGEKQ